MSYHVTYNLSPYVYETLAVSLPAVCASLHVCWILVSDYNRLLLTAALRLNIVQKVESEHCFLCDM